MSDPTPPKIENPPGMGALNYRIAPRAAAALRMRAALGRAPAAGAPPSVRFDSQVQQDPVVALIDAWATAVDVLSFYQERIANEGFLRTAVERRSVVELARLVGQRPRPGVAADTFLAYTVEKGIDAVEIPAGSQAQSVPGPGQLPQIYETSAALIASAGWNQLTPLRTRPFVYDPATYLSDDFFVRGIIGTARPGRPVLIPALQGRFEVRTIMATEPLASLAQTRLRLKPFAPRPPAPANPPAPAESLPETLVEWLKREFRVAEEWLKKQERLDAEFIRRLIHVHPHRADEIHAAVAAATTSEQAPPTIAESEQGLQVFQIMAGLFGSSAAEYRRPEPVKPKSDEAPKLIPHTLSPDDKTAFEQDKLHLDNLYEIPIDSLVLVIIPSGVAMVGRVKDARPVARAGYDLVARVTELTLLWLPSEGTQQDKSFASVMIGADFSGLRQTTVYAAPTRLEFADRIETAPVAGDEIELDGVYADIERGRTVVFRGATLVKETGARIPDGAEVATVARVDTAYAPARSILHLAKPLTGTYARESLTIFGNVVPATHGETIRQTLGSGDGSARQSLPLRQGPLVYVPESNETGSRSSLEVRVDGVLWHEAGASPEAQTPASRVYTIEQDQAGARRVLFGDGILGARLPSGIDNVTAVYRIGQGLAGNGGAGQISLPITRPLGVKTVTNPLPATGGASPESRELLRRNAPRSTTLFDRLVSAADYEHFAAAFAGVGKARSRWMNLPEGRRLCLTIAGMLEAPLNPAGELFMHLRRAFADKGDPRFGVKLVQHRLAPLQLVATIRVDPDYLWDRVEAAIRNTVYSAFGYAMRGLGDPLELSPLISQMQQVKGVLAVDIRKLHAFRSQVDPPGGGETSRINAGQMVMRDGKPLGHEVVYFAPGLPEMIQLDPWLSANGGRS